MKIEAGDSLGRVDGGCNGLFRDKNIYSKAYRNLSASDVILGRIGINRHAHTTWLGSVGPSASHVQGVIDRHPLVVGESSRHQPFGWVRRIGLEGMEGNGSETALGVHTQSHEEQTVESIKRGCHPG